MARNDGVDRTCVRNQKMSAPDVQNAQAHNEREKEIYSNQDIVSERRNMNVHFKTPTAGYEEMFDQMVADGVISTRGLKADAHRMGELVFDVNSAYFYNHGGYEFAKQFYADAYQAAVKIVGGEQYILSAVMHADERNRAMSDALGEDVYHYHLHVVYVPVVEKEILWSKRCKDEALRGTVKEIIHQVSMSKKWNSVQAMDEEGKQLFTKEGKPVLKKSYSVLQDDFYQYMRTAGYNDVERGERESGEEHLTVTQFKVQKEQKRLENLTAQTQEKEQQSHLLDQKMERLRKQQLSVQQLEQVEAKPVPFTSKVMVEESDFKMLKTAAEKYVAQENEKSKLKKELSETRKENRSLKDKVKTLTEELFQFKSVKNKLHTADLERENEALRELINFYERIIEKLGLRHLFQSAHKRSTNNQEL